MASQSRAKNSEYRFEPEQLQLLIDALREQGYEVVGPTVRDGVIVYDELNRVQELPIGLKDEQDRGSYRLTERQDGAYFGYVVGPQSWKKYLFPPQLKLWEARRNGKGFEQNGGIPKPKKLAFFGVRGCELEAIHIQDRVFVQGDYIDPYYAAQRKKIFIVAVHCTEPGVNCFCASVDSGPKAGSGYDLALTEVLQENEHYFVLQVGSRKGQKVLEKIPHRPASQEEKVAAAKAVAAASTQMKKKLHTENLKDVLYNSYEHKEWEVVARRCLTCGNCTMVCPTCFCSTVEDVTDLSGEVAVRIRRWDSCFAAEHSYIHGGSVRSTPMSRYRQWMTHKLATWVDQFGTMGCVGCGRCITWCPVGIDITQEASILQRDYSASVSKRTKES